MNPSGRSKYILLCALAAAGAQAQTYPSRPVRMVVSFPPGSGADITTRMVMPKLSEAMGQQFIVDNRAGAAGHIGAEAVAKSPPDGYTLLSTPASVVISQSLYKNLPYNFEHDLDPFASMALAPYVLVVHPSVPAKTLKELIALAKTKPGQIFYGSTGNGSTPHLAMEVMDAQSGIKMNHVPYKGTPQAVTDLLAGQVQVMFAHTLSVLPMIQSGRLRALAISSSKRSSAAPQIPTVAEAGVPGFEASTWFGLFAPTGTSRDITNRINAEVSKIMNTPDMKSKLLEQGADPFISTPDQFRAFVKTELVKWAKVVQATGVKIE